MTTAALEPVRWGALRQGVTLVAWSWLVALVPCGAIVSVPMLVIGARAIMRWAPTSDVERAAELLLYTAIAGPVLAVAGWIGLISGGGVAGFVALVVAATVVGIVQIVGLVRTMRGLARWAAADAIVRRWDRAVPRFIGAVAGMVLCALAAGLSVVAVLAAVGFALWAIWLLGYPLWCTYRLFGADVWAASSLPPPPPVDPQR